MNENEAKLISMRYFNLATHYMADIYDNLYYFHGAKRKMIKTQEGGRNYVAQNSRRPAA